MGRLIEALYYILDANSTTFTPSVRSVLFRGRLYTKSSTKVSGTKKIFLNSSTSLLTTCSIWQQAGVLFNSSQDFRLFKRIDRKDFHHKIHEKEAVNTFFWRLLNVFLKMMSSLFSRKALINYNKLQNLKLSENCYRIEEEMTL